MKVSKFKVLLYLKKSGLDKQGKAPIMGRITLNNSMAQFSCKLSCNPKLWNSRSGRLEGKSKDAVEMNARFSMNMGNILYICSKIIIELCRTINRM